VAGGSLITSNQQDTTPKQLLTFCAKMAIYVVPKISKSPYSLILSPPNTHTLVQKAFVLLFLLCAKMLSDWSACEFSRVAKANRKLAHSPDREPKPGLDFGPTSAHHRLLIGSPPREGVRKSTVYAKLFLPATSFLRCFSLFAGILLLNFCFRCEIQVQV